jgi:hypothetical protein
MSITKLTHELTISLAHRGAGAILGVSDAGALLVEVLYADADYLAQYRIAPTGAIIAQYDERDASTRPLALPPDWTTPRHPRQHRLNYRGGRYRGLRATDRVSEWVQTLSIAEKMALIAQWGWSLAPMAVLGVVESHVYAQMTVAPDTHWVVRRVRIAYALPAVEHDDAGLPYDYDSVPVFLFHRDHPAGDDAPSLADLLADPDDTRLYTPQDGIYHADRLMLVDGGSASADVQARVLVFRLDARA